ncbi:tetratricopeptide repeat protein [Hydrogenimonas sp.]
MKKSLLALLILMPAITFASYFSDGIRAYKTGDYIKAKEMLEKAVQEEGAEQAHFFLGLLYLKGKGVKQDLSKARRFLQKAVRFGNVRAKCYLAEAQILSKTKDKKRILNLLKEGRKNGASECTVIAAKYDIPL